MNDDACSRPFPFGRERLRSSLLLLGLISGVALTLGWWTVLALGLYRLIG